MSDKKIYVRALETVYYGDVRRRPAEIEDLEGGGVRVKKAGDIFMLRERKGKDANNRPITLTVEDQLKAMGESVEVVNISLEDVHQVQAARREMENIDTFERQQAELDEETTAEAIMRSREGAALTPEQRALQSLNTNNVDQAAQAADLASFTEVKSPQDIENEKAVSEGREPIVIDDGEILAGTSSDSASQRTVL